MWWVVVVVGVVMVVVLCDVDTVVSGGGWWLTDLFVTTTTTRLDFCCFIAGRKNIDLVLLSIVTTYTVRSRGDVVFPIEIQWIWD